MSRSMGDLIGKQAGVVSTPFKAVYVLQPHDRTMVLASDGVRGACACGASGARCDAAATCAFADLGLAAE